MKLKNNIYYIVFSIVLLFTLSCNPNLTRDKLNVKDQIFWDLYHNYNYCKRIDVFESYTKDWNMLHWYRRKLDVIKYLKENTSKKNTHYFPFTKENLFEYKFNDNYIQFDLFDDYSNSFYGYIYHDIINYCQDTTYLFFGYEGMSTEKLKYPMNEWPPMFFDYKEFEEALIRWRNYCKCDTIKR